MPHMSSTDHQQSSASTRRYGFVLAILIITEMVSAFETSSIYSALPTFYKIFNQPFAVGWLLTSFLLVAVISATVCGRLGDLYGRRRMMLWVLAAAFIGSLISALSTSLEGIIVGRAVQGVAGAIFPLCFGLARENVTPKRLPFTVGVIGSAAAIGGGIGTMLGGLIVDHLTWHWIFYSSSAMSALAFVLILCLPSFKPAPSSGKLDVLGGLLFVGGIGSLLGGLSFGQSWGWFSASTLGLLFCGFLILVFWWRYELRLANPLLDVRLLVNRQVALANVAFFLLAAGAMNSLQILMVLLQQPAWTLIGLGISATLAGLLKFPSSLISAAAGTWGGMIATRHGGRAALLVATVIVMAAWGALAINHGSVTIVILMMLLAACGMVISYGAVANLVVEATPAARTSEATGLLQVSKSTGMVIGSQFLALLMSSSTISNPALGPGRFPDALAYDRAILFVMAVSAIAVLAAWLLPRRERHSVDAEQPVSKALA